MKYLEAKKQFQYALDNQQSISIKKLKKLMQSLNMSLESTNIAEIRYLKGEIKKLRKELRKLAKK